MPLGSYLLVITERECAGSYLGHPIFKISSMKVFPCDHSLKSTPAEQVCFLQLPCFLFNSMFPNNLELIIAILYMAEEDRDGIFCATKCC